MIKRLIFDVDGTLITNVNFISAVKKSLNRVGINSEESIKGFLNGIKTYEEKFDNYNINDYITYMGQAINKELPIDFLEIFFEELKTAVPEESDRLADALNELSKKYKLVILTNYFKRSQLNRLDTMGIAHYFDECYGEEKIKPNSEAYKMACGKDRPEECIMIGDDINLDIKYAMKNGLNAIFVNTKGIDNPYKDIIEVSSVEEITVKLIDGINNKVLKGKEDGR